MSTSIEDQEIADAAQAGDVAALRVLLADDRGRVHNRSRDGWTPLHLAAYFGHVDVVRLLLDAGADVDARSTNAMANTALHAAAAGREADGRQADVARLLLDHGADVDARQHGGWTALHAAAENGDTALVELLLSRGAKPGAVNDTGQTPLSLAIEKGHADVIDLLERAGVGG